MAERVQKSRTRVTKNTRTEVLGEETTKSERRDAKEELEKEMDELLDEIDSVLEENAQLVVDGYVQQGGQ